ncbi:protein phosphatase 2C domain-containing protein [Hufsiella ginkgonis]|uniref:SpoIIE family protein phosphatase n=1 Tax=Hufsiella ginkgonis TaxID=2695274 RepID=A0A7K1Y0K8_9SPHI|nr:protein phosphatase 2C domain-containing protein [Hufsiella ginkgonis]MXV16770.1 SpoIIE family protein phosphatase [Hufsiella ginkgonis]
MAENYFGMTDQGRQRSNNEDTFIAAKILDNRFVLACVIDGVGGYEGGEVAAALAEQQFLAAMSHADGELIPAMIQAFGQANDAIYEQRKRDKNHENMACVATMAVADVAHNVFYYAHVGDTRLYLLRDGSLIKITKDHSFVGFLEDSGRLSENAAMTHMKRNEINKALGFTPNVDDDESYIETGQSPFLPGDLLLLCSDGLTDLVNKSEISLVLSSNTTLAAKASALVQAANDHGGRDNITVVLVENDKALAKPTVTRPAGAAQDYVLPASAAPVAEPQNRPSAGATATAARKKASMTPVFAFLSLLFLASTVWLFVKWQDAKAGEQTADSVFPPRNAQEIRLQEAIDRASGDTLLLPDSVYKSPILISDTLYVQQDSLYLLSKNGMVLKRDPGYNGPALVLAGNCKYLVLDSVKLEGFATAVHARSGAPFTPHKRQARTVRPVSKTPHHAAR